VVHRFLVNPSCGGNGMKCTGDLAWYRCTNCWDTRMERGAEQRQIKIYTVMSPFWIAMNIASVRSLTSNFWVT
jgi:hypothetical protein